MWKKVGSPIVGAVALAVAVALVVLAPIAPRAQEGAQLVDDLRAVFGKHRARAVHTKGVILEGHFSPTQGALALSRAVVFAGPSVPVTIRFSDFTGIPDIPDNIEAASPRGLGIRFWVGGDGDLDIVSHSFNGFPTATAYEFGALLRAIAATSPESAKPTPVDRFLDTHPVARTFLSTEKPPPVSYATSAYFGVNSVAFLNAGNERHFVRHRFLPEAGEHYLDKRAAQAAGPNYLQEEIAKRVSAAPIRFGWYAQLAEAGDKIEDPSIAWPESRALVRLGTITVERMLSDQATADRNLLFMPGTLPNGIVAADPMLAVRNAAYPVSFRQRQ